jgi:hypothetical protein
VKCYEAASVHEGLVVSVGIEGACLGVRLSPAAMGLRDEELASRIVQLNTLAYLRRQLAVGQETPGDAGGLGFIPSAAQVAAYARTLER